MGDEEDRRAAVAQTGVLERGQLIDPRGDQQPGAEHHAGARHHRGQEAAALQPPLRGDRDQAEGAPDQRVAGGEDSGRHVGRALLALLAVDHGEQEDHRRGARQHHRHHHGPPHEEHQDGVAGRPGHRRHRRHRHVRHGAGCALAHGHPGHVRSSIRASSPSPCRPAARVMAVISNADMPMPAPARMYAQQATITAPSAAITTSRSRRSRLSSGDAAATRQILA